MEKTYHSLKDFELSYGKNAIERANDFQQYIEQLNDFGCKSYWITSHTGIGSTMAIEGFNEPVIAFISNDYLGMSQREETKQAGIDAIKKYGTGACAAQVIGGYLDIHQQLEKEIALKSATKLFSVLLASKRPLITELADKLRLKYPLLPTISPCPTMRLEAIRSIIPISCRRYPKSV